MLDATAATGRPAVEAAEPSRSKIGEGSRAGEVWTIVLAAGGGARFGGPKQFADLGGRPMVTHTIHAAGAVCDGVVVVLPEPSFGNWAGHLADLSDHSGVRVVVGGASRADSVRAGLTAVPAWAEVVVVTDAAHPLATADLYRQVVDAVRDGADAAVPGLPLTEVVKEVVTTGAGTCAGASLPRETHRLIQTPHAFRADALRAAHAGGREAVEDSAMVAESGGTVVVVPGEPTNIHVTTPEELAMARLLLPQALGLLGAGTAPNFDG
jgi:2-C-methyl-D-erythritol 4-phosphate cytidylyltransferase